MLTSIEYHPQCVVPCHLRCGNIPGRTLRQEKPRTCQYWTSHNLHLHDWRFDCWCVYHFLIQTFSQLTMTVPSIWKLDQHIWYLRHCRCYLPIPGILFNRMDTPYYDLSPRGVEFQYSGQWIGG